LEHHPEPAAEAPGTFANVKPTGKIAAAVASAIDRREALIIPPDIRDGVRPGFEIILHKVACVKSNIDWVNTERLLHQSPTARHFGAILDWMSPEIELDDLGPLGSAIRERRLSKLLTLIDLAHKAGLSQPFLSQVENGRARPSLMSLHRIADALDTTPQAFFGGPSDSDLMPNVVRADEVQIVPTDGNAAQSTCHVLLGGDAPFHMLEFDGLPTEFLEYFEHDGFEAAYVIRGRVEIDISGDVTTLNAGDTISYPAQMPHRLRAVGKRPVRVLLIETKVATVQDRSPGIHAPASRRRRHKSNL
jgi:transcriptional regulator with XRE-family HTH domain